MIRWGQANMTAAELGEVAGAGQRPETQAILDKMPPILQETLLFPYTRASRSSGAPVLRGGWAAVDAIVRAPPEWTEQILHPGQVPGEGSRHPGDAPEDLATRLGGTWKETSRTRSASSRPMSGSSTRVARRPLRRWTPRRGWGGDRVVLIEDASGAWAVVLDTAWDTDADQAAFVQAAQGVARKLTTAPVRGCAPARGHERGSCRPRVAMLQAKVANVLGLAG